MRKVVSPADPMVAAITDGDIDAVRRLIQGGYRINKKLSGGLTALHAACAVDNAGIVQLLISSGANIKAKTPSGLTPIIYACHADAGMPVLECLISSGANTKDVKKLFPEVYKEMYPVIEAHALMAAKKPSAKTERPSSGL